MLDRLTYFLVIAEELNITNAAKRLFVSQQCLSSYLKELEEELGTRLFQRRPTLMLTSAGKLYYRAAKQIQQLQNDVKTQLQNAVYDHQGELSIGVHSSRSVELMPEILDRFWQKYPNVRVNIVDGVTDEFERMLQNGELDLYIGINPRIGKNVEKTLLFDDRVYVVISDQLLHRYFFYDYPGCLERLDQGACLKDFCEVPFIFNHTRSNMDALVQAYLIENGIQLTKRLATNSAPLRIEMTIRGYGACICNAMRMNYIAERNKTLPPDGKLFMFPIVDAVLPSRIYLVCRQSSYRPAFFDKLQQIIREYFSETYMRVLC